MNIRNKENGWALLVIVCTGLTVVFKFLSTIVPGLHSLMDQAPTIGKVEIYVMLALGGWCLVNWIDNRATKKSQEAQKAEQEKTLQTKLEKLEQEIKEAKDDVYQECVKLINERTELIKMEMTNIKSGMDNINELMKSFIKNIDNKFENITEHLIELSGRASKN